MTRGTGEMHGSHTSVGMYIILMYTIEFSTSSDALTLVFPLEVLGARDC